MLYTRMYLLDATIRSLTDEVELVLSEKRLSLRGITGKEGGHFSPWLEARGFLAAHVGEIRRSFSHTSLSAHAVGRSTLIVSVYPLMLTIWV